MIWLYKELEASHEQVASGEYRDADVFIAEVRKRYGI